MQSELLIRRLVEYSFCEFGFKEAARGRSLGDPGACQCLLECNVVELLASVLKKQEARLAARSCAGLFCPEFEMII